MASNGEILKEIKTIKGELLDFHNDFNQLKMSVIGSKQLGINGLVQKGNRNTEDIRKLQKFVTKVTAIATFIVTAGGLLIGFWNKIFK